MEDLRKKGPKTVSSKVFKLLKETLDDGFLSWVDYGRCNCKCKCVSIALPIVTFLF
jgi:hypothetical protein